MFGKKDTTNEIKVIKVQHTKRTIEETKNETYGDYTQYNRREKTETKTLKDVDITIVLFTQNGVLSVREFNGHWDLKDIKNWEV